MYLDRKTKEEVPVTKQIEVAFSILSYNQGLIQFADTKANGLLLINSIFLAALSPFIATLQKLSGPGYLVFLGFLGSCILSILLSMNVISTRKLPMIDDDPATTSLVYYKDIVETTSPEAYINEFNAHDCRRFLDSLLRNIYIVSSIAHAKFSVYSSAQSMTFLSCLLWIACMVLSFFGG
ncbi:MAG: hypothetical protein OZSIB_3096 [Candidatus Ozemobacter sibiricus]|uniref:Pycsar effector protein domain-containing protein n=1 Tax=Candidatus Ozemobacter sibiricus TaxID=2268124 RepID=A0A367ZQN2_9BACT|nr:MAG: hypothetical protein OZSIB_3096 [Candidatus Ozemobacter sibiricus]